MTDHAMISIMFYLSIVVTAVVCAGVVKLWMVYRDIRDAGMDAAAEILREAGPSLMTPPAPLRPEEGQFLADLVRKQANAGGAIIPDAPECPINSMDTPTGPRRVPVTTTAASSHHGEHANG